MSIGEKDLHPLVELSIYTAMFSTACATDPPLHFITRSCSDDSYKENAMAVKVGTSLPPNAGIWLWIQLTIPARVIKVVLPCTCVERYSRCKIFRLDGRLGPGDS